MARLALSYCIFAGCVVKCNINNERFPISVRRKSVDWNRDKEKEDKEWKTILFVIVNR